MVKNLVVSGAIALLFLITGCSNKIAATPANMVYNGNEVDYSKIDKLKESKICKGISDSSGDTTIITAARAGGISKVKHVDTSFEYTTFLFFTFGAKHCITVYGE